ncbi:MAG: hypothetical protein Q9213_002289 [Squamulea squamosa]
MSGFEIAGIALAVFPIVINGLNHVVAGIETAKRWKRYRLKLKDYADVLESASVYFLDTLDELLGDIVRSDELSALLENPGGMQWKQTAYEERLRERLDRSYNSYHKTVSKLAQALQAMCKRLGVDNAGTVKWDDYSSLEREMKRLKMTFSKSVYKEFLDEIRTANQDLREVTHQNIALEPAKQKRRGKRPIATLRLIRRQAASLYQVLMNDKTWKCRCKAHHLASLRLEARPQTNEVAPKNTVQAHAFRILLSVAIENGETDWTAQWQDIEILPSVENEASNKLRWEPHRPLSSPATRGVRSALETGTPPLGLRDEKNTEARSLECIGDFCSALCAPDSRQREIGLLIDEANGKQEHRIYRANTSVGSQTSSRSLENLLGSQKHLGDENLSQKDPLGLTLVELCFGRTLTNMRKPDDADKDETATRLRTAMRLHPRIYDEMGIPYGSVVRRCLYQLFDVRELDLDIEEVQQKVFDDVVTPLMDELNNFNGALRIR